MMRSAVLYTMQGEKGEEGEEGWGRGGMLRPLLLTSGFMSWKSAEMRCLCQCGPVDVIKSSWPATFSHEGHASGECAAFRRDRAADTPAAAVGTSPTM